jgi:hypothetical protein
MQNAFNIEHAPKASIRACLVDRLLPPAPNIRESDNDWEVAECCILAYTLAESKAVVWMPQRSLDNGYLRMVCSKGGIGGINGIELIGLKTFTLTDKSQQDANIRLKPDQKDGNLVHKRIVSLSCLSRTSSCHVCPYLGARPSYSSIVRPYSDPVCDGRRSTACPSAAPPPIDRESILAASRCQNRRDLVAAKRRRLHGLVGRQLMGVYVEYWHSVSVGIVILCYSRNFITRLKIVTKMR